LRKEQQKSLSSTVGVGTLTLEKGKAEPAQVELATDSTLIGKDDMVSMKLKGLTLPRGFFSIERTSEGYFVNPWELAGKVKIDGKPVNGRTKLRKGCAVGLGGVVLRFGLG
jgi:hypothetical protein